MNETAEHRERKRSGWGCAVAILLLSLFYLLSPPLVAWMFGGDVFGKTPWLWWPIVWLEFNSDLYVWYLNLWPDWVWD